MYTCADDWQSAQMDCAPVRAVSWKQLGARWTVDGPHVKTQVFIPLLDHMEKYLSSPPLSAGRFIMKWESGSSTIKWEESGVFIFTSADNSWQLVTIWFIIINHCYSWIIPGSQQISLYRFISFLDVTMSHLSQNDKRSCARDTQPECPSAQNFLAAKL